MTDSGSDVDNTIINTQSYSYMHETCTRLDLSTFHHGWKKNSRGSILPWGAID